jgi:hypothetical protein
MEIYIDESGGYQPSTKPHSISCVAALVVPSQISPKFFEAIKKWAASPYLQHRLGANGEIKGKLLNESECASFLKLMAQHDVIVEVVCTDMGMTSDEDIVKHKNKWPQKNGDDSPYEPSKLINLSSQLYAQMHALFTLIHQVIKVAINYYVQRLPHELGSFEWIIDAKDSTAITTYEGLFAWMIMPVLQSISKDEPLGIVNGFDYSHFNNEYLIHTDEPPGCINISALMNNIRYVNSQHNIGLQAVDVVVSCIRRAMVGNLQFDGWKYLEKLVVFRKDQAIRVQGFIERPEYVGVPYGEFVNFFTKYGKQMLVT